MDNNFVKQFFGIDNCILLKSTILTDDKGKAYNSIELDYSGDIVYVCPKCGGKMHRHGKRQLKVIDTPFGGNPVVILINYPRTRCQSCNNIWQPEFSNVNEKHKMTNRAFLAISQESLRLTFEEVTNNYMLSANTIKNIFVEFVREKESKLKFKTPSFLGIDEIKINGIGEVTVITDLEHRTMYDMLLGRNQQQLTDYFKKMPGRENVLWVCTDMYRPFEKSIRETMPNARWVIDHFHVVMKANQAMDYVRKTIQAGLSKEERINTKKGLAYTLRYRLKDLDTEDAEKLRLARKDPKYKDVMIAYDLKEDFFNIYDDNLHSKDAAISAFNSWEESIPEDEIFDKFRDLAKTVKNFYTQIFQFWDCPIAISNGYTECANRLIRENNVKGRGYGFEVLRARTLFRKTNLETLLRNDTIIGPDIPENEPVFHYDSTKEYYKNDDFD